MTLHVPTIFVMIMVATATMALSLAVVAYRRHRDLLAWSLALLLQVFSYGLFMLRGQIHDALSVILGNMAITASLALYAVGLFRFQRRQAPGWLIPLPMAVVGLGCYLLISSYAGRVLLLSAVWLLQCVHVMVLIHHQRQKTTGRGQYILGVAAAVFAASMVHRLFAVLTGSDFSNSLLEPTALTLGTYLASILSTLLLSVGVLTMTQERAERALSDSESRYRKLIDSANEGIVVLEGGQLRFANPKALQQMGRPESELLAQSFDLFIHPEDRALVLANRQKRLQGGADDLKYAVRLLTKHQGVRWFDISEVAFEWQGRQATLNFLTDVTERQANEDQIRDLAFHDTLTHLPNRRLFLDHLHLAMASNQRSGQHGAVLFMDMDNFKPLNDLHGHAVGDLLLMEVAQRLLKNIRDQDTAARFGGDEFVALLNGLSEDEAVALQQAEQIAQKILQVLGLPYVLQSDHGGVLSTVEHRCTATAGLVLFLGKDVDATELLDHADEAMYQAKQAGRNRVQVYKPASAG